MTPTTGSTTGPTTEPQGMVLRAALVPFAVVAAAFLVGWSAARGWDGTYAVLAATALVGLFFGSGFYVERRVRRAHPMVVMAAAMAGFALKFMLLAGLLIAFRNADLFDRTAFASAAIGLAVAWLAGEVRAFTKGQFYYTDAGAQPQNDD